MKKLTVILLSAALCVFCISLSSCLFSKETYEIALITGTSGVTNRSSAQGAHTGIDEYCRENNIAYNYFVPDEDNTEAYLRQVEKAVSSGAELIVFAGYYLQDAAKTAAELYDDVNFLLVDCYADIDDTRVHSITFREEQAGFLAGFAAVTEGYTELGFITGDDNEISQKYGSGFIQGAEYAAVSKGIPKIYIKYWCAESLKASDELKQVAIGWYGNDTEIIMVCGEGIQSSVTSAANNMKGKVIGFDMDQAGYSERYVTSAIKSIDTAVYSTLEAYYKNSGWDNNRAGKSVSYGIETDNIGLPTNFGSFRFSSWTVDDYETLYAKIKSGKISVLSPPATQETTACEVIYFESGLPETNDTSDISDISDISDLSDISDNS
ncbi:MAG: BMP family ABC transporter substrate-binding protein [Eubacteriales bacterium]|nr:BMP family ABC transporter substrate-binding protein [Eubacteriales bacterium]